MSGKNKLGLIVNPRAGIGGSVGLKGSDGEAIQQQALVLGAIPRANERTIVALMQLAVLKDQIELLTYPAEMGAKAALTCGFTPQVIGAIQSERTSAEDTIRAASEMVEAGIDLLLFSGGDGTARDIYRAIALNASVVGVPAGVKIHSAVFGINPLHAGELARLYLQGKITDLREAEVMDIDEEALRLGIVSASLCGYLKIPYHRRYVQNLKSPSAPGEAYVMDAVAAYVIDQMETGWLYILGAGTTTRAIATRLGLDKTLVGVDVLLDGKMYAKDVNEGVLLSLLEGHRAKIIIAPIGGQGYLFGRGNQQISAEVIRRVGRENILVISTPGKIASLRGQPFLVDTGCLEVDEILRGYVRVITGYGELIIYRIL